MPITLDHAHFVDIGKFRLKGPASDFVVEHLAPMLGRLLRLRLPQTTSHDAKLGDRLAAVQRVGSHKEIGPDRRLDSLH